MVRQIAVERIVCAQMSRVSTWHPSSLKLVACRARSDASHSLAGAASLQLPHSRATPASPASRARFAGAVIVRLEQFRGLDEKTLKRPFRTVHDEAPPGRSNENEPALQWKSARPLAGGRGIASPRPRLVPESMYRPEPFMHLCRIHRKRLECHVHAISAVGIIDPLLVVLTSKGQKSHGRNDTYSLRSLVKQ